MKGLSMLCHSPISPTRQENVSHRGCLSSTFDGLAAILIVVASNHYGRASVLVSSDKVSVSRFLLQPLIVLLSNECRELNSTPFVFFSFFFFFRCCCTQGSNIKKQLTSLLF